MSNVIQLHSKTWKLFGPGINGSISFSSIEGAQAKLSELGAGWIEGPGCEGFDRHGNWVGIW